QNVRDRFVVVFVPDELQSAQRGADHAIDLVGIFPDALFRGAEAVLGKFHHIAGEDKFVVTFLQGKDVFGDGEKGCVDDVIFQHSVTAGGGPSHGQQRYVFSRFQAEVAQHFVGDQRCRAAGRTAGDFFASELFDVLD